MTDRFDTLAERLNKAWSANIRAVSMRALHSGKYAREDNRASGMNLKKAKADLDAARHAHQLRAVEAEVKATEFATPRAAAMAAEIRAHMRSLPPAAAMALALKNDDAARAILEAPAFLSGVDGEMRANLQADFLQRCAPEAAAQIAIDEAGLEHAKAAIEMAGNSLRDALGTTDAGFSKWLEDCGTAAGDPTAAAAAAKLDRELKLQRALADMPE